MSLVQKFLDYLERYRSLTLNEIGNAVVIGVLASIAFVFIFPDESISTLMHDVFHLPGPGAGIALLVGPAGVLVGLLAYSFNPRPGSILFSVVVFGLLMPMGQVLFNPDGLGQFPFFFQTLSFIFLAVVLELLVYKFSKRDEFQRIVAPAVLANVLFLVFWWLTIFQMYLDRWPLKEKVEVDSFTTGIEYVSPILILVGISFVGSVLIGAIVPLIMMSRRVKKSKDTTSF